MLQAPNAPRRPLINLRVGVALPLWGVVGCLAATPSAMAQSTEQSTQSPSDTALEDIVVTARRQTETLMSVPVAASVVSGGDITRRAINDLSSLAKMVPQVGLEPTTGAAGGAMTIRGIGSSGTDSGTEQTVSVNFDGVQVSRGQIIREALFDVEQVEILKGPQALFFGKNSPGGVLSVRSRGPGDTLQINGRASYEFNAREKILEVGVSAPISDSLGIRVALRGTDMRGWMKNNAASSIPNPFFASNPGLSPIMPGATYRHAGLKEAVGRATLVYRPTSDFTATLKLFGGVNEYDGDNATAEFLNCANPPFPTSMGFPDIYNDCKINGVNSVGGLPEKEARTSELWRDGRPYGRFTSYMGSLTLDYSAGPLTFTSVTGLLNYKQEQASNAGNSYISYAGYAAGLDKYDQFSQEFRVVTDYDGPINLTAGVYYEHNRVVTDNASTVAPFGPDPATGKYAMWERSSSTTGDAYSAFGQVRWLILDSLELAGGVRYTLEKKTGRIGNDYILPVAVNPLAPLFAPQGLIFRGKTRSGNFSPEITLSWRPSTRTTLYGAFKTGFKSGGFGAPSTVTANFQSMDDFVYEPEKARGGEIGLKTMLFDNSLRLTVAAYRYNYKNLQLSNFNASNFQQSIVNAGGSRTQGFEAEAQWRVAHELTLRGGVGYSKARYTRFTIACYAGQTPATGCDASGNQDLSGMPLVRAPDWTAMAGADYETALSDRLKLGLSVDARYSSSYYTQENDSPFAIQGKYAQVDASVRIGASDDRWQLALIGKNLTDKSYAINTFDNANGAPGDVVGSVSRPRQIMVDVSFRY